MDEQAQRQPDSQWMPRRVIRIRPILIVNQWDEVEPPDGYPQDDEWEAEPDEAEGPYWTPARIAYWLVLLITLLAFLAYTVAPAISALLNPPAPPPPIFGPRDRA
jgi:hypothetical protein